MKAIAHDPGRFKRVCHTYEARELLDIIRAIWDLAKSHTAVRPYNVFDGVDVPAELPAAAFRTRRARGAAAPLPLRQVAQPPPASRVGVDGAPDTAGGGAAQRALDSPDWLSASFHTLDHILLGEGRRRGRPPPLDSPGGGEWGAICAETLPAGGRGPRRRRDHGGGALVLGTRSAAGVRELAGKQLAAPQWSQQAVMWARKVY